MQATAGESRRPGGDGAARADRRQALIDKALDLIEQRLDAAEITASLADLVRLLQMAGELEAAGTQVVIARWVDPEEAGESEQGAGGGGDAD